jgi:hypothetical protein
MNIDDTFRNEPDSKFSFGVSEMRLAYEEQVRRLATIPSDGGMDKAGFDPYNSGGFDRTRGWTKVKKR